MPRFTDDGTLKRRRLLPEADCAPLVNRLLDASTAWRRRGPAFHTLGAATYLDVCSGAGYDHYRALFNEMNPILAGRFPDLLEVVRAGLEAELGRACFFNPALALPGFHIFLTGSLNAALRDNLHLDLQHTHLPMGFDLHTPSFTFTLPIELPAAGGGIEICQLVAGFPRGRLTEHEYRLGELFIHSGRALHRRAHRLAAAGCRRITLQGHGVAVNDTWALYW